MAKDSPSVPRPESKEKMYQFIGDFFIALTQLVNVFTDKIENERKP